jgi:cytochrome c2
MKKLEVVIGVIVATLFAATAFLAISVVAALLYSGPATTVIAYTPVPDPGPSPAAPAPAAETGGLSLAAGERSWGQCKACHTITKDGRNGTGPNLWGILDGPVAARDFAYSPALAALSGQIWDATLMERFLESPKGVAPGTKMAFAGMRKAQDRANLIAWMSQQSETPAPMDLAAGTEAPPPAESGADVAAKDWTEAEIRALYDQFAWLNPPVRPNDNTEDAKARAAEIASVLPGMDYEAARFHPLHYPPASLTASNAECLACHQEILTSKPRAASLAGVQADATLAWYQTLDTYEGAQESFHYRHLQSDFARATMNLQCVFCHKGNDPREETPDMIVGREAHTAPEIPEFTLRKMVNPSTTCLACHGAFPAEVMGLEGHWHDLREGFEYEAGVNGCLSCHEETFRTTRHLVDYLKAGNIEALARMGSSDSCYGCHGGRQWFRIPYPYSRNPWPGMDTDVPDWAAGRPTRSDPAHAFTPTAPAQ